MSEIRNRSIVIIGVSLRYCDGRILILVLQPASPLLPARRNTAHETVHDTLHRIVKHDLGLHPAQTAQLPIFDTLLPSDHQPALVVPFLIVSQDNHFHIQEGAASYEPLDDMLSQLPEQHTHAAHAALIQLRRLLLSTNIAHVFLPERFTMTEIIQLYQTLLDTPIQRRNFSRYATSHGLIRETEAYTQSSSKRPSRLYMFCSAELSELSVSLPL